MNKENCLNIAGNKVFLPAVNWENIYGRNSEIIENRQNAYQKVLNKFGEHFGEQNNILLSRCPSRINIRGVHIEHQGGWVNYMTHRREILLAASPRKDDRVILYNARSENFSSCEFIISEELKKGNWTNWMEYISDDAIEKRVMESRGNCLNYIRAAVLRLQSEFPDKPLSGMNLCLNGDIPLGAGLSSSSALVVAATMIWKTYHQIPMQLNELVKLCSQAEWYVGTRGGAGDHAAMLLGRKDFISRVQFYPLQIQYYSLAKGYSFILCNSFQSATKSDAVRGIFNSRVATYTLALEFIKMLYPQYAEKLQHLRNLNVEHLDITEEKIYKILRLLPEKITREEIYNRLNNKKKILDILFKSHEEPSEGYRLRDVCLFGLAECERGKMCIDYIQKNDMRGLGNIMSIAHDGDRIVTYNNNNREKEFYDSYVTNEYLEKLIEDSQNGDLTRREQARLYRQPGKYRCSNERLDLLVDIVKPIEGVLGAGLTGAGLGGCILVLVEDNQMDNLFSILSREFYEPLGLPFGAEICHSVAGAETFSLNLQ